ncbi:Hypothetical predicted protein [Octopus vulgaris]|uniref:Uncharacterized protein n=1 Tax=Octopus vulgaris TaxID=6645 RepID=A0AA36FEI3_OCTVU|nr:Hypothetical predicted protein [Octopus vulgaris]
MSHRRPGEVDAIADITGAVIGAVITERGSSDIGVAIDILVNPGCSVAAVVADDDVDAVVENTGRGASNFTVAAGVGTMRMISGAKQINGIIVSIHSHIEKR